MPDKMTPLSVRMSADDIAMLSALTIPDAVTPSEKIRRLVRTAHRQQQGRSDYAEALRVEEERIAPLLHRVRALEASHRVHSELLVHLLSWLPDMTATAMSSLAAFEKEDGVEKVAGNLAKTEAAVAERVFGLMLTVLQYSLTPKTHCYREDAVTGRLPEILEIARLLEAKPARRTTRKTTTKTAKGKGGKS
ncbi:MAG: hypothetical protein IMF05_03575 [Proteobacteria bacterium]|nr:hypothetical protein [Pseudomonadota bacterium]